MKVISLFDGISGALCALKALQIPCVKYYAYEIDPFAIKVSGKNHPEIIQCGSVVGADFMQYRGNIDLLIGGSPCQDLSIANKDRKGLAGERSGLFFEYVRALKEVKPTYFLLENVASMKKKERDKISNILGVEPVEINSALLTAQSRKRLYWCNWKVLQPENMFIKLKDILESGITDKYKAYCLKHQAGNTRDYFKKHQTQVVFENVHEKYFINDSMLSRLLTNTGKEKKRCFRLQNVYGKSTPLLSSSFVKASKDMLCVCENLCDLALRTFPRNKKERVFRTKHAELKRNEKANNLTRGATDSMVCSSQLVGNIGSKSQGNRVYSIRGKSVALSAGGGGQGGKTGLYLIDLPDGEYRIRKLTPIECERLQGFADNYTSGISDTQRYKALGNSFTVPVIAHILGSMGKGSPTKRLIQNSLI